MVKLKLMSAIGIPYRIGEGGAEGIPLSDMEAVAASQGSTGAKQGGSSPVLRRSSEVSLVYREW